MADPKRVTALAQGKDKETPVDSPDLPNLAPKGTSTPVVPTSFVFSNRKETARQAGMPAVKPQPGRVEELAKGGVEVRTGRKLSLEVEVDWERDWTWDEGEGREEVSVPVPPFNAAAAALPQKAMENRLIYELLLYLMLGEETDEIHLVTLANGTRMAVINPAFPADMRKTAEPVLEMSREVETVRSFAESRYSEEYGAAVMELCEWLEEEMLDRHARDVAWLEKELRKGGQSLLKLWVLIRPLAAKMEAAARILRALDRAGPTAMLGGGLLSLLKNSNDVVSQENQLRAAAQAASAPAFLRSLALWLAFGILEDPYSEFFIRDTQAGLPASSFTLAYLDEPTRWERRYEVVEGRCPPELKERAEAILEAGRNLNILQKEGEDELLPPPTELMGRLQTLLKGGQRRLTWERELGCLVDDGVEAASTAFLAFLRRRHAFDRLVPALHVFFLTPTDWLHDFLRHAWDDLALPADQLDLPRLQQLLKQAVQESSISALVKAFPGLSFDVVLESCPLDEFLVSLMGLGADEERDSRRLALLTERAGLDGLIGREALDLRARLRSPLSLVFPASVFHHYSILFRQQLAFHLASKRLNQVQFLVPVTLRP